MLQEAQQSIQKGLNGANIISRLNNVLMQMRKNCNHPDLITGGMDGSIVYPSPEELREQGGKLALLERLVSQLHKAGHKIIIFSQASSPSHCQKPLLLFQLQKANHKIIIYSQAGKFSF